MQSDRLADCNPRKIIQRCSGMGRLE